MMDGITEISTNSFILDSLGYCEVPLDQRAVVFCRILKELDITYRKYYTSPCYRHVRVGVTSENTLKMSIVFNVECTCEYAGYVEYLYKERMKKISLLNKCFYIRGY